MPSFVLTGTPGAGKTAILRRLEADGFAVVEEAATDVIALRHAEGADEPWREPGFVDAIVTLQRRRERTGAEVIFHDRSPVCTLALSRYAGLPPTPLLTAEVRRARSVYARTVFFVRNQGFVVPTAARRITLAESLAFEEIHLRTYRETGFDLIDVPPGPLATRVAVISSCVRSAT